MKPVSRKGVTAVLLAALAASPALAQPGPGNWQGGQHDYQQPHPPGPPPGGPGYHPPGGPGYNHPPAPPPPHYNQPHPNGWGYNSGHRWRQGNVFNGHRYVVNNWQDYRLRQPPYGYQWVYDGNQFVLLAITSGIIASVIAGALSN